MSISFDCFRSSINSASLLPLAASEISQIFAYFVAVPGIVHHDEENGLFAQLFMLRITLAPFLNSQAQIIVILFRDERAGVLSEPGAAGLIRQDGMLDHVLRDSLHERVVTDGLHKDSAVVVARRGGHVNLNREAEVFLQQPTGLSPNGERK